MHSKKLSLGSVQIMRSRSAVGCRSWHGLKSLPICHGGFVRGYTKNGFNEKLLNHVSNLMESCERRPKVQLSCHAFISMLSSSHSLPDSFRFFLSPGVIHCPYVTVSLLGTSWNA